VAVLPDDPSLVDQKGAGHLERISNRCAKAEAAKDRCFKTALPDRQIEDLPETTATESKLTVEFGRGIAKPRDIGVSPPLKEWSCLRLASLMNERDPRSCRFDRLAAGFHLGQRLATESSAIVAQKDGQDRLAVRHLPQTLSKLIADCLHHLHLQQSPV